MGTAMKMASRSIDLVSKITNLHVQHTFFLVSKKTNLHVQHTFLFFFAVVLHDTMPFCTTKMSNFQVTHYFYGGIVVCAYQRFCFLCSCSLLFSCGCLFSPSCWALLAGCSLLGAPCWPLAFLFFSLSLWIFHVFLPSKFVSFVFNHLL